jgi:hypothetical protein
MALQARKKYLQQDMAQRIKAKEAELAQKQQEVPWQRLVGKSMDEYGISFIPRGGKYGTSRQLRVISSLTNSLIDPLSNPLTKLIH